MSSKIPKFISLKQVASLLGASTSSAGRYALLPGFPDPFYIGGRKLWDENEVITWALSCRRPRAF